MSNAHIIDIEAAFPEIPTQFDADTGSAIPVANVLQILGTIVANGINTTPLETSGSGNTVTVEVQVGAAITGAPSDSNDAGLVSFNDSQFTVDSNGYVQLIGGGMAMDTLTGDDAVAVSPDGAGNTDLLGVIVANATNAKPLYVDGDAASNKLDFELQVGAAITGAPGDKLDAGLSSYDDTQFACDADGYVTLVGAANLPAIQTLTSDDPTAVGPDASGNIDITGETVANATNAKPVFVDAGTSALNIEMQVGVAIASAPGDKLDAGLISLDSSQFSVDSDGFTQIVNGGFTWNDVTGTSDTMVAQNGYVANNASLVTLTLPASCTLGDTMWVVSKGAGFVKVAQNASQTIQFGSSVTTSGTGGSLTATNVGDTLQILCTADDEFYVLSSVGNWTIV